MSLEGHMGIEEGTIDERIFKSFLKRDIVDADVTFCGRVFHSQEAATGKARSPMVIQGRGKT